MSSGKSTRGRWDQPTDWRRRLDLTGHWPLATPEQATPESATWGKAMRQTRDSVADVWGERTPYFGEWPVRVDERTTEDPERWVQSACVLCSNGCGMDI